MKCFNQGQIKMKNPRLFGMFYPFSAKVVLVSFKGA